MKAAQISEFGDPSVIHINEVDKPRPGEGQVLVEVYAASLNPFDTTVRSGRLSDSLADKLPLTLGGDIAGTVSELGTGVTSFKVGDKVYGQANVVAGNSGAFAEYAATKASQVALAPSNLDFKQAAAMPLVGVSALQALTEHIELKRGQSILIIGGSGGIGSIAIQIAKDIGAKVITSTSGDGLQLVKQLGADEVYDYKTQDVSQLVSGVDAVFDTAGGQAFNAALGCLKHGGTAVSMIAQADEALVNQLGVKAITQQTKVNTEKLDRLRQLIETEVVKPQVSKVFKLGDVAQAFLQRESGQLTGKVVIEVKA